MPKASEGSKAGRQEAGGFHQGVRVQADVGRDRGFENPGTCRACVTVIGSPCRDGAAPPAFDPHPIPPPFRGREERAAHATLRPRGRAVGWVELFARPNKAKLKASVGARKGSTRPTELWIEAMR